MAFLRTTWHHIRRSPYQAIAAVLIMMLTFLVVSIFSFVVIGSTRIIAYFESKPQVTAFFKDDAKQENIDALKDQVKATGKIASTRFVTKKEALEIYRQQNKNDPLLLELVTADILPSSLEVSTKEIADLKGISELLKSSPLVQEVVFQKDVVATLTSWTNALRQIGIVLIILLFLVSVFIIVTITGIKISQRREEIEIMRLLGATNWYVRWPFIFEGMFYGVVGALLGWTISSLFLWYASPSLASFLRGIPVFPFSLLLVGELLGIEILLSMWLGAFASFLAVLRYLK